MLSRHNRRDLRHILVLCVLAIGITSPLQAADKRDVRINYEALIDGKAMTHSGQPVSRELILIRTLNAQAQKDPKLTPLLADRLGLVEPYLEPLGILLDDALYQAEPNRAVTPLVEVAALYRVGGQQPAWVDLLRTRHYLVLSDGRGYVRVYGSTRRSESSSGSGGLPEPPPLLHFVAGVETLHPRDETLGRRLWKGKGGKLEAGARR